MKISTLIIIVLLGVIAYALLNPRAPVMVERAEKVPAAAIKPQTPAESGADFETLQLRFPSALVKAAVEGKWDEAATKASYEDALRGMKRWEIHANVVQHLPGGRLLLSGAVFDPKVRAASTTQFVLFGHPHAKEFADGDMVDCLGGLTGMYESSGRTVREFAFVTDPAAEAPAAPGAWMYNDSRGVLNKRAR